MAHASRGFTAVFPVRFSNPHGVCLLLKSESYVSADPYRDFAEAPPFSRFQTGTGILPGSPLPKPEARAPTCWGQSAQARTGQTAADEMKTFHLPFDNPPGWTVGRARAAQSPRSFRL